MSKHTKGPWVFTEQPVKSYGYYIHRVDQSDKNSFIGDVGGGLQAPETIKANARLIAASPEMYDILQEILSNEGMMPDTLGKINNLLNKIKQ